MNHKRIKDLIASLEGNGICKEGREIISNILTEFGYSPPEEERGTKQNPHLIKQLVDHGIYTHNKTGSNESSLARLIEVKKVKGIHRYSYLSRSSKGQTVLEFYLQNEGWELVKELL
tara:strand:- start:1586 stop:1936 length:351 start_codon:yes stop_codon:yes gene_type:complete